jgi:hypothetical protein
VDVVNAEHLVARFGEWPSFHDGEVLGLRLDSGQRSDGVASLELDVHVFGSDGQLPTGRPSVVNHTVVTLRFEDIEALELDGFGPQNVLFDLVLEDVGLAAGRQVQVRLPSSNGLAGRFRCRRVTVIRADDYEPGPHSVYSH